MKKPYITKTVHNTFGIYVPIEWIETISPTQWTTIIIAMESWSIWKTNIEPDYTGWEFSNEISPEMIQNAFFKCSNFKPEIIR